MILLAGCNIKGNDARAAKNGDVRSTDPAANPGESSFSVNSALTSEESAAAREIFKTNCSRCHALGDQGGRRGRGPDLSRAGRFHDANWIVAHVRDPGTHNPRSGMPKFDENKLRTSRLWPTSWPA
jgi:mono/diheme cytochrome c family protein